MKQRYLSKPAFLLPAVMVLALLVGCKKETASVYRVPKEQPGAPQSASAGSLTPPTAAAKPSLGHGPLPAGWEEMPASGMRVANFLIKGENGQDADLAVIPLPELAGKELEFVNMWREQIQLEATSISALAELREAVTIAGHPGQLFDMVSSELMVNGQFKQRIVVAMATAESTTWFFKLTGADELVAAEKPRFVSFLETAEFKSAPAPALAADPHAGLDMTAPGGGTALPAASAPAAAGLPRWTIPDGWKQTAPGPMLLASFELPGGNAKVTVSSLGGEGGGLLANINRWRGQLQLAPITDAELPTVTNPIEVAAGKGTVVDMSNGNNRLVAVVIPHGGQSWFYKSMGDTAVVGREKDAFVKFAQSAQY